MSEKILPVDLRDVRVHLVGIKGTGLAAFAELLHARGARVTGSDTAEKFYTDAILDKRGIRYTEGFSAENVPSAASVVVFSSAYDPATHPEITEAVRRGIPTLSYTEALGEFSAGRFSCGVTGVHGKTTTTAMLGSIVNSAGLDGAVLVGSGVPVFGGGSVLIRGDSFFAAETCEYRRHFLSFHPSIIVITNVEADHLDYYRDYDDVRDAFVEYASRLPAGGRLIACEDDAGVRDVLARVASSRPDIRIIRYGFDASGPYRIANESLADGAWSFTLGDDRDPFTLRIPGRHNVLNAAAAVAAVTEIVAATEVVASGSSPPGFARDVRAGLESYTGTRRRSEVIGCVDGITILDDYGHHPTEIAATLGGIKEFYTPKRLIVDFMAHTFTRTARLLAQFAEAFSAADVVIVHKIYASARETFTGSISGVDLADVVRPNVSRLEYFEEPLDAAEFVCGLLEPGDVFVTMGAGDNWRLGRAVLERLTGEQAGKSGGTA